MCIYNTYMLYIYIYIIYIYMYQEQLWNAQFSTAHFHPQGDRGMISTPTKNGSTLTGFTPSIKAN